MASTQQIVLITGATSGIGLSFARYFSKRPNHFVIGTTRDASKVKELEQTGCKVVDLDVSSSESCAALPKKLADKSIGIDRIDILINNAGMLIADNLSSPSVVEDTLQQIDTNALGPLRVTIALMPFLKRSVAVNNSPAKVVNISSRMGSVTDNTSGGYYGYRASKAAENMISVTLARDLEKEKILSLVLHPGMIKTKMTGGRGDLDADECVNRLVKLIDGATQEDCYKFLHRDGNVLPW